MSESIAIVPGHIGDFRIGTGQPGARTLIVTLSVLLDRNIVSGSGHLSQAIPNPVTANTAFHGTVVVEIFGASSHQIYTLEGSPLPPRPGAPHISKLDIRLNGVWGTDGTASYTLVEGGTSHDFKDLPVKVKWLLG
jgi:Domain of unknown function (DUF1842)